MADKEKGFSRRDFLRLVTVAGLSGLTAPLASCTREEREQFFQKHFLEMTDDEKKSLIKRLQDNYLQKYGKKFEISTQGAQPNTLWGYGLDLSRCIGCRRCVYGCVQETIFRKSVV